MMSHQKDKKFRTKLKEEVNMINGFCHTGSWGSFGNLGGWGWIGLILYLLLWIGSIAGFTLLVVWFVRHARVSDGTFAHAPGRPAPKEVLQAQYARGEMTREQYELNKQNIDELKD